MSVLNRKELAESPLADLHQIASELGMEGYRSMRKDDLIGAILGATGAADDGPSEEDEPAGAGEDEQDTSEGTSDDTSEGTSDDTSEGTSEGTSDDTSEDEPDEVPAEEALERPARRGRRGGRGRRSSGATEEEPEVVEDEVSDEEIVTGVLDILANGSGFVRVDPAEQSRADVYVSPAQIRRCEMRAGDEVSGPARPPRRNERHPSLVRVETVNGAPAEPVEERPWFGDLTPVFPTQKFERAEALNGVPFGRGSRVAVAAPTPETATALLLNLATSLIEDEDHGVQVVLVGTLPEMVTEWRRNAGSAVAGGSFDRSPDAQAQAAELAVERAKRRVERGRHAVVLIDSLDALPAGARRRIFGAGRATEEGGTLTIVAAVGFDREALRWATSRVVFGSDGQTAPESGALRAEALSA